VKAILIMSVLVIAVGSCLLVAANSGTPKKGTVERGALERIQVPGKSLEGSLEGDSSDRDVSVYLPASYATERSRRYPVVYLLHGYTNSEEGWFGSHTKSGLQSAATTVRPWPIMPSPAAPRRK
jgi:S-formylglutathione hydrolase FrmB